MTTRSSSSIPTRRRVLSAARRQIIIDYAERRGRISSTEIVHLLDISVVQPGRILTELTNDNTLRPSRPNRSGRGLYYLPTDGIEADDPPE